MKTNLQYLILVLLLSTTFHARATTLLLDGGPSSFQEGDTLNLSAGVQHNEASTTVDVYLALVLPNSDILFLSLAANGSTLIHPGTLDSNTWTALVSNLKLPSGFNSGLIPIFEYTFNGQELLGKYQWVLAITLPGDKNILQLSSHSFTVTKKQPQADKLLGHWDGSWTDTTFDTTGASTLDIVPGQTADTLNVTLDLDGFIGGFIDPDPETMVFTVNNDGSKKYSGNIDMLGPLQINITAGGEITVLAEDIDSAGFEKFEATGNISDTEMNLRYTVSFSGSGSADGVVEERKK